MGVPSFDGVQKRFGGFCGFYEFNGVGAAHKNIEAPRSYKRRCPKVVCSHQSLLIPGHESLIPAFKLDESALYEKRPACFLLTHTCRNFQTWHRLASGFSSPGVAKSLALLPWSPALE